MKYKEWLSDIKNRLMEVGFSEYDAGIKSRKFQGLYYGETNHPTSEECVTNILKSTSPVTFGKKYVKLWNELYGVKHKLPRCTEKDA